ncbi:MAG: type II secretion system F family protein, partial [Blastocatellia bacterium]
MALLVALVTFLTASIIILAIWISLAKNPELERLRNRMEALRKAERRGNVSVDLQLIRDETFSSVPLLNRLLMKLSWSTRLQEYIRQAGLKTRSAKILLISGVLGLGVYAVTAFYIRQFPIPLVAGLLAAVVPFGVVSLKRSRRLKKFEEHFPDALDLLGRAVRAGHAFTTGMEIVAKEVMEPIGGEFKTTFEEQNFGLPLRDVLLNMTDRVPIVDVHFFVTALLLQKETGGNLAEILDSLSRVIRERFRIYRDVKVKTAQGRISAAILIAMPIIMISALSFLNPHYMRILFDDPTGMKVLAIAGCMQIVGSLMLWKIVNIE